MESLGWLNFIRIYLVITGIWFIFFLLIFLNHALGDQVMFLLGTTAATGILLTVIFRKEKPKKVINN
jgi:hypothetical protein